MPKSSSNVLFSCPSEMEPVEANRLLLLYLINILFQKPVKDQAVNKHDKNSEDPAQTRCRKQAEIDKKEFPQHFADILFQIYAEYLLFQLPVTFFTIGHRFLHDDAA